MVHFSGSFRGSLSVVLATIFATKLAKVAFFSVVRILRVYGHIPEFCNHSKRLYKLRKTKCDLAS